MEVTFIKKFKNNENLDYDVYRFNSEPFDKYMNTTNDDINLLEIKDYLDSLNHDIFLNEKNNYFYFDMYYLNKDNQTDKEIIEFGALEIESIIDQLIENKIINEF